MSIMVLSFITDWLLTKHTKEHQVKVTFVDFVLLFILSSSLWLLFLEMDRSLLSLLRSLLLSFFPLEKAKWGKKKASRQLHDKST